MNYKEIEKDLFQMDREYALAHCISADCKMGAGIAKTFRNQYPSMPQKIRDMSPSIGDAKLYTDDRRIFNLITKERHWHKPSYQTFELSILNLKEELVKMQIKKLAIPQLGAGLDKLDWDINRSIIQHIFRETDIEITTCVLK